MVLLNYESFIKERIGEQLEGYSDNLVVKACSSDMFHKLLVKLYEYCEEINIIERRMKILAEETEMTKGMKPKLLESETVKVCQKIKEIGSIYSVFLINQERFKVLSDEATFYETIYKIIIAVMEKCFSKGNFEHLHKEINRLLRTNTFNRQICWDEFIKANQKNPELSNKKKQLVESNFKHYRRGILSEKSDVRPYVNNKSCFRSKNTRSPIITLLYPNNEYMEFDLKKKQKSTMHS